MKRIKLVALPLVVAGLSFGIAACGDDDDDAATGGGGGETSLDLVIGVSLPLTGDLADFGPPGEKAADLGFAEVEAAIEEVGADHTVELVKEDNCGAADPQCAVQAHRKLVTSDGASCVAGPWGSADVIPAAESVAVPEESLIISPSATAIELTELDDDGLVNRTPPADNLQGPVLAQAISDAIGGAEGKTLNIGARNDAYGTGFADAVSAAWEELGGTVGETVVYDTKLPSYDTEAEQIVGGNPDAIAIVDFPETYNKVGPALVRAGFDPKIGFITDGLATSGLPDAGAEATVGLRGTAPGTPEEGEASEAFDQLFTESEPTDVERQTYDGQNFDAVILCYLAAVAAGSTEGADMAEVLQDVTGPPGDKYTWEQLPEAIEALQNGDDIDYVGAAGEIDLDENGDPTTGVYDTYEVTDNPDELFKPYGEQVATEDVPQ
jgi:ABC-type branched-subunit amino acid transport system substrate-binding protein